jgi:ABC-type microcin C transport system duplicated ATPase subunit YejF
VNANLLWLLPSPSICAGNERRRGISGGQRKRVNIGMELVCDPKLLVLDEPTSGLDSTSGLRVIHALQTAAVTKHVTIICVLHQPRYVRIHQLKKYRPRSHVVSSERSQSVAFSCPDMKYFDAVTDCSFWTAVGLSYTKATHDTPFDILKSWATSCRT